MVKGKREDSINLVKKYLEIMRKDKVIKHINVVDDIEDSIEDYGIDIKWSFMGGFIVPDDIRGYITQLEGNRGKPVFIINGEDDIKIQRYTIAYLLGMLELGMRWEKGELIDDSNVYLKKGREDDLNDVCHIFSILFLIEDKYYTRLNEVYKEESDNDKIKILSNIFKVKEEHIIDFIELNRGEVD